MGKAYIKNGTPVGSESLCKTCASALIFTGYRESEQITMCTYMHPNIVLPFTVNTCTGYQDKNRPSWKEMKDLAIDVTPAPLKPVGFKVGVGFHETTTVRTRINVDLDEDEEDQDNPFAGGERQRILQRYEHHQPWWSAGSNPVMSAIS